MASSFRSLPLLLFASLACTQIIGLGDLEKTDEDDTTDEAGAGGEHGGSTSNGGGTTGGRAPNGGMTQGGSSNAPTGGNLTNAGEGGRSMDGGEGGTPPLGMAGAGGTTDAGAPPIPLAGLGGTSQAGAGGSDAGSAGESGGGTGGTANCIERELLVDGNFDESSPAWLQQSTDKSAVLLATPLLKSSPYAAWLGQYDAETEDEKYRTEVYQVVTIPEHTVALEGHCQCRIRTAESGSGVYDEASLYLSDPSSPTLDYFVELDYVTDDTAAGSWFYFGGTLDAADLADLGLVGVEVAFDLYAANDFVDTTDFFVDNCSLVATVCE